MTTQALIYTSALRYRSDAQDLMANRIRVLKSRLPRPCMLVSVGLLSVGLAIAAFMALAFIPASLFLGFIGFSLFCVGLVMTSYYFLNNPSD